MRANLVHAGSVRASRSLARYSLNGVRAAPAKRYLLLNETKVPQKSTGKLNFFKAVHH